ncbi:hypothetical protein E3N88_43344 [Mikania micrantha]|uniref:Uncharacterized protein n=1 Tax=Mikania micrantha TaxID=192012 RepID=A0A5N6LHF1_9ASTR|nr:hypothetical protein E3N88_43344 [Mikania micrantha]
MAKSQNRTRSSLRVLPLLNSKRHGSHQDNNPSVSVSYLPSSFSSLPIYHRQFVTLILHHLNSSSSIVHPLIVEASTSVIGSGLCAERRVGAVRRVVGSGVGAAVRRIGVVLWRALAVGLGPVCCCVCLKE